MIYLMQILEEGTNRKFHINTGQILRVYEKDQKGIIEMVDGNHYATPFNYTGLIEQLSPPDTIED
ncbi:hypothetical protein ACFL4Q_02755 [candidate division KSB1 bacterium]